MKDFKLPASGIGGWVGFAVGVVLVLVALRFARQAPVIGPAVAKIV